MKHLFIPYELAVIAKEKGFDEPCIMFYEKNNDELKFGINDDYWGDYSVFIKWNSKNKKPWKPFCEVIAAPLYQQIIDWFYDKKIVINLIHTEFNYWFCTITVDYTKTHIGSGNFSFFDKQIRIENNFKCFINKYEALNKAIEEAFILI